MGDPVADFRQRKPSDILPNPKAGDGGSGGDAPVGDDKKLPTWAKCIIVCNLVMVHSVVVAAGIKDVPFTLGDAALAAYVVTGLGVPVGLASRTVRGALAGLFGIKS